MVNAVSVSDDCDDPSVFHRQCNILKCQFHLLNRLGINDIF